MALTGLTYLISIDIFLFLSFFSVREEKAIAATTTQARKVLIPTLSIMEPFTWSFPNGSTVSGILSIPPGSNYEPKFKPLIVGLHGGGYDCQYFDGDSRHTAKIASKGLGVPFIAIDRPCYGGTSSVLPIPPGSSFITESASRLHSHILPHLWTKYGMPEACTCVVLLCHSLGVAVGVATAAAHAKDETPEYPLGGLIVSGLGHQQHPDAVGATATVEDEPTAFITMPVEVKDKVMFRPGTVDSTILQQSERLNRPVPVTEIDAMIKAWIPQWRETWGAYVTVPVLFAMAELDLYFLGTQEHVEECVQAFPRSKGVEGIVVRGAPHCMELSHWSSGWYARCFGFAIECAATYGYGGIVNHM